MASERRIYWLNIGGALPDSGTTSARRMLPTTVYDTLG